MYQELLIWLALGVVILLTIASFLFSTFGLMFLFGAPWVRTPDSVAREMLAFANVQQGETVIDLGSGDGSILLVALREFGAQKAIGYELHPMLNIIARLKARWYGVSHRLELRTANIFHEPIAHSDVVTVYLLEGTMDKLQPKLAADLLPGTRVISRGFAFTQAKPAQEKQGKKSKLLLYMAGDL